METLFHYTNIDALALILKNRTIRFKPLDTMDDLEENLTADVENAGMFTYVSCWTSDEKENLALWKQYTRHDEGVRIELPKYPFKKYHVLDLVKDERVRLLFKDNPNAETIIRMDKMLESNYTTQVIEGDDILFEVNYTENEDEIIPQLVCYDPDRNKTLIKLGCIGKTKRAAWCFQKEQRYRIQFLPANMLSVYMDEGLTFKKALEDIVKGKAKQPFPFYDLEIDDQVFEKMNIVLSPTISAGNEILIRNTIEKYNPQASLRTKNSCFYGKIR